MGSSAASFFVLLALTQSPLTAVIALVVFLGYQQLENNVISPAIVGSAVNLTPPTTMLAALVGGAAAGVPGALVATPLLGAAKALYLDQRGELPPRRDATLTRRIKARMARLASAPGGRRADGVGRRERRLDAAARTRTVVPAPGAVVIDVRPPWARTVASTIESPSPLPPWWRLREASAR